MMNPQIAIVIVNWNKKDHVLNLLHSLKTIDYDNHDVIVVDNASTDGSVDAIKMQFPIVHLIVNPENLGGTGGFNTGMQYALEKKFYKYIWLLDNDAEVEEETLRELVNALEKDNKIGLAGSRIVDIDDRDITIEAGALFQWNTIGVKPLFRNERNLIISNTIEEVDYVAICSALVRTDALNKVGLLDERYFIFWDDMDWGLQFKKMGYKVIAVLNSIVYHPAFTEKRSALTDYYYGNRNSLLTYSKHAKMRKRPFIFLNSLRHGLKSFIFLGMSGRKDLMLLAFKSILDFIIGRWGKINWNSAYKKQGVVKKYPEKINKIIVLNGGYKEDIQGSLKEIKKIFPEASYTLLIENDRVDLLKEDFNCIIQINRQNKYKLHYLLFIFIKVFLKNYQLAINPKYPSPFSFAVKRAYAYDSQHNQFYEDNNNLKNIWKLLISTVCGEIISIILFPFIFIKSLKYR